MRVIVAVSHLLYRELNREHNRLSSRLSSRLSFWLRGNGAAAPNCEERPRAQWCRRWPPPEQERTRDTVRRSEPASATHAHSRNKTGGVASRHRWARGPTSRDGTPPDNQRSWYPPAIPRACGVPHDGEKHRRIPARYRARAPVGDVGSCSVQGKAEEDVRKYVVLYGLFDRTINLRPNRFPKLFKFMRQPLVCGAALF